MTALKQLLMFLMHHVGSHGVSEATLRFELDLDEDWLDSLAHEELIELIPRLLECAEELTTDKHLCLHIGECFHFCLAGLGGLVATHAPTPALALETFGHFIGGAGVLSVQSESDSEKTSFAPRVLPNWTKQAREKILDGYFASMVAAMRTVCGASFMPLEVRLSRDQPVHAKVLERVLHSRVRFNAERDEILIETKDLKQASILYEQQLYEQLRFMADMSLDQPSGSSPMRQLVEQAIQSGDHSVEKVAETLQITKRTLQRRLQTEGTTFRSVLNEVRVGLAKNLLLESELSLSAIAERLNYSDDKGLRKAIRQVTGMSPSEIRKSAKS